MSSKTNRALANVFHLYRRRPDIWLHIGLLFFLFGFPLFFLSDFLWERIFIANLIVLIISPGVIFYINYLILVPRYFLKKKHKLFIAWNVLLLVALLGFFGLFLSFFPPPGFDNMQDFANEFQMRFFKRIRSGSSFPFGVIWYKNLITYLLAVGAAVAIRVSGKLTEEENRRKQEENEHLKSEIASLKYQLQPHFLFNTLNNVYALIDASPAEAKDIVHQLGKLMRYILRQAEASSIPLEEEIAFIKTYIEIMKVRQGAQVKVETEFPAKVKGVSIPPLLFLSLVENAFKHGVDAQKPSCISIVMSIEGHQLLFETSNSYFPKSTDDESGSGIGLENLQKRLSLLYSEGEYDFRFGKQDDRYHTHLSIKLQDV